MFTSFSFKGLYRHLRRSLFGHEIQVTGACVQCGACCRDLCLDVKGRWISSVREFERLKKSNPDYERFEIIERDSDGCLRFSCSWLSDGNVCRDHENRLNICRSFPDIDMFYMRGALPATCGFRMRQGAAFEKVLERKMKKQQWRN